ncbi:hypothetical protein TTHERM_001164169 (macronuclear) [Tetrahymena thermophila SB210]|uniref:Uncharacterized protein n=1 Tax=Tetrahymena thermophila (strain SB210) TaxID=312017 RepID=W7X5M8_TETTS|nr:hypothetical protein TTHERM_001164169 [Tetrahymena thermophila SB210]EWS71663.1 hypothetical protein TTHERM_001164169 [Tetrahymena thermophila SB210]|eukprot:XP_012655802.1 hypothetical protein TTHERM_001164169 [Tetrahymena thermophila SB210]
MFIRCQVTFMEDSIIQLLLFNTNEAREAKNCEIKKKTLFNILQQSFVYLNYQQIIQESQSKIQSTETQNEQIIMSKKMKFLLLQQLIIALKERPIPQYVKYNLYLEDDYLSLSIFPQLKKIINVPTSKRRILAS